MTKIIRVNPDSGLFSCYETEDQLDRRIRFFLSKSSLKARLPLSVWIQGSGCHSVFRLDSKGRLCGGYQNVLYTAAKSRLRVLVIEKPGVRFLDNPSSNGTTVNCSAEFLEEHTLPRWTEAISASISAVQSFGEVDTGKLLVIGHSEGGLVAARLSAVCSDISHVAVLSSSGPTQLFDFFYRSHLNGFEGASKDWDFSIKEILETYDDICAEPFAIDKFAWGHPYRRWASFLATSTLDELLRSTAKIYLAHGEKDRVVPLAAFIILHAELVRHRRDVVAKCVEGADHSFCIEHKSEGRSKMAEIMEEIVDWFLNS